MNHDEFVEQLKSPTDFECSCGRIASFHSLMSHRKGWRKRPECHSYRKVGDPWQNEISANAIDHTPTVTLPIADATPGDDAIRETGIPDSEIAPENDESLPPGVDSGENAHESPRPSWLADTIDSDFLRSVGTNGDSGNGNGNGHGGLTLDGGDWNIVPPGDGAIASEDSLTVKLDMKVWFQYDYFRQNGWHVGKGTMSDFVNDMLTDHFDHCLDLIHLVMKRSEVIGGNSGQE